MNIYNCTLCQSQSSTLSKLPSGDKINKMKKLLFVCFSAGLLACEKPSEEKILTSIEAEENEVQTSIEDDPGKRVYVYLGYELPHPMGGTFCAGSESICKIVVVQG